MRGLFAALLVALALLASAAPAHAQLEEAGDGSAGGPPFTGVLDTLSTHPFLAVSSRRLSGTRLGGAGNIRRASDQATTDICFVAGAFDSATFGTFCAATQCFVTQAYDQTNSGNHLTQVTAANQPRIQLNIVNTTRTGFNFTPSNTLLLANATVAIPAIESVVAIFEQGASAVTRFFYGAPASTASVGIGQIGTANTIVLDGSVAFSLAGVSDAAFHAGVFVTNGASSSITIDGATTIGNTGVTPATTGMVWQSESASHIGGELFIFGSALSVGDIAALHTNQSTFWGTP